jgi:hypothetical protein
MKARLDFRRLIGFLCQDRVPIWLMLFLTIGGALGAYWVAPHVNETFQIQAAKREFLVESMTDFSSSTNDFLDKLSKFVNDSDPTREQRVELLSEATALNFYAVQIAYVLPNETKLLADFQNEVLAAQSIIANDTIDPEKEELIQRAKNIGQYSLQIYSKLSKKIGF